MLWFRSMETDTTEEVKDMRCKPNENWYSWGPDWGVCLGLCNDSCYQQQQRSICNKETLSLMWHWVFQWP